VTDAANKGSFHPSTVVVYAYGRIALWSNSEAIRSMEDLRQPEVLHVAIANPEHAPYGIAARQALENRHLGKAVERKLVYGENAAQALPFAESGDSKLRSHPGLCSNTAACYCRNSGMRRSRRRAAC